MESCHPGSVEQNIRGGGNSSHNGARPVDLAPAFNAMAGREKQPQHVGPFPPGQPQRVPQATGGFGVGRPLWTSAWRRARSGQWKGPAICQDIQLEINRFPP